MITILADEGKNKIGYELWQGFLSEGAHAEYIPLENVLVKPCINCGNCNYKSYGKCVFRDDGDWIYPKVIRADVTIMVTPITFGSYSFRTKRVIDKFGILMDHHYFVENSELVKGGMPGRQFKYFAVGVNEDCVEGEADVFRKLVHETIVITRGAGKAYITGAQLPADMKSQIIAEVMQA